MWFGILKGENGQFNLESRRFYASTVFLILIAVVGFPKLIIFTEYIAAKIYTKRRIKQKWIVFFWIFLIGGVCIGKGLSPQRYKAYIHEVGATIRLLTLQGKIPLLLLETRDKMRIGYYGKIKCVKLGLVFDPKYPVYFKGTLETFNNMGYQVFLLEDNKAECHLKDVFDGKKIKDKIKFIRQWKKGKYTLYRFD